MCVELRCARAGFSVLAHRLFLGGGLGVMCGAVNGGVIVSWFGAWFGPRMWGIWVCRDGG